MADQMMKSAIFTSRVVSLPVLEGFCQRDFSTLVSVHDEIQEGWGWQSQIDCPALRAVANSNLHRVVLNGNTSHLTLTSRLWNTSWVLADVDVQSTGF